MQSKVLNKEYGVYKLEFIRSLYRIAPNNYKKVIEIIGKKYAKSFRLSSNEKDILRYIAKRFATKGTFTVNYKPLSYQEFTMKQLGYITTPNQDLSRYADYIEYLNRLVFIR